MNVQRHNSYLADRSIQSFQYRCNALLYEGAKIENQCKLCALLTCVLFIFVVKKEMSVYALSFFVQS